MEQILLAYGIPKETVAAITILYRNTKVKVRPPDGDTEYFDIVAGVLQGDTLAPYLFIICLDYVLRTSIDKIKENGFELTKKRSRRYPATTITDADYADDIAILANTPDQAETLLHSLERAAASIGLYVNAHKTEYMCYNQTGDISTLEGTPLKLVDKFTYLRSSVESTEKDIETRLTKAWTAINRLSIIWKSDLTDKMKRSFFQAAVTSILNIQTDHLIPARGPDLIIINNKKRICKIVDFVVPADHRINQKECEKKDKYLDVVRELKKAVEHESDDCVNCDWCFWHNN